MFDIGFWELCVIAVVALLILGPERLPIAARTAGLWIGRARRMIGNVKSEIDRELQLDEIRSRLKEEENTIREDTGMADFENLTENTIADVNKFQAAVQNPITDDHQKEADLTSNLVIEEPQDSEDTANIDPDINTGHSDPDSETLQSKS